MFHIAHKQNEPTLMDNHQKISDSTNDQSSLASLHQEATDIYKRLLIEYREYLPLPVYVALCYYKFHDYVVSLEMLAQPDSIIAINLKACTHYQLYDGKATEQELKGLIDSLASSSQNFDNDLVRHNLVVFRNGGHALQIFPPLLDVIPEARLSFVICHLRDNEVMEAYNLSTDPEPTTHTQEYILKGVVNASVGEKYDSKEHLKLAQQSLQCNTIRFRQVRCHWYGMIDAYVQYMICSQTIFLAPWLFEEILISLNPVTVHFDQVSLLVNFNYGIAPTLALSYDDSVQLPQPQCNSVKYSFGYIWVALCWLCISGVVPGASAVDMSNTSTLSPRGVGVNVTSPYCAAFSMTDYEFTQNVLAPFALIVTTLAFLLCWLPCCGQPYSRARTTSNTNEATRTIKLLRAACAAQCYSPGARYGVILIVMLQQACMVIYFLVWYGAAQPSGTDSLTGEPVYTPLLLHVDLTQKTILRYMGSLRGFNISLINLCVALLLAHIRNVWNHVIQLPKTVIPEHVHLNIGSDANTKMQVAVIPPGGVNCAVLVGVLHFVVWVSLLATGTNYLIYTLPIGITCFSIEFYLVIYTWRKWKQSIESFRHVLTYRAHLHQQLIATTTSCSITSHNDDGRATRTIHPSDEYYWYDLYDRTILAYVLTCGRLFMIWLHYFITLGHRLNHTSYIVSEIVGIFIFCIVHLLANLAAIGLVWVPDHHYKHTDTNIIDRQPYSSSPEPAPTSTTTTTDTHHDTDYVQIDDDTKRQCCTAFHTWMIRHWMGCFMVFIFILSFLFLLLWGGSEACFSLVGTLGWSVVLSRTTYKLLLVFPGLTCLTANQPMLSLLESQPGFRGLPIFQSLKFHIICGSITLIATILHGIGHIFNYRKIQGYSDTDPEYLLISRDNRINDIKHADNVFTLIPYWTGITMACAIVLPYVVGGWYVCQSRAKWPNKCKISREVFEKLHYIAIFVLFLGLVHGSGAYIAFPYGWISNSVAVILIFGGWGYYYYHATHVRVTVTRIPTPDFEAGTTTNPKGCYVELVIPRVTGLPVDSVREPRVGDHIYVRRPAYEQLHRSCGVHLFQHHPFSVCRITPHHIHLYAQISEEESFTRHLWDAAGDPSAKNQNHGSVEISWMGPFHTFMSATLREQHIVMVASNSLITPFSSIAQEFMYHRAPHITPYHTWQSNTYGTTVPQQKQQTQQVQAASFTEFKQSKHQNAQQKAREKRKKQRKNKKHQSPSTQVSVPTSVPALALVGGHWNDGRTLTLIWMCSSGHELAVCNLCSDWLGLSPAEKARVLHPDDHKGHEDIKVMDEKQSQPQPDMFPINIHIMIKTKSNTAPKRFQVLQEYSLSYGPRTGVCVVIECVRDYVDVNHLGQLPDLFEQIQRRAAMSNYYMPSPSNVRGSLAVIVGTGPIANLVEPVKVCITQINNNKQLPQAYLKTIQF